MNKVIGIFIIIILNLDVYYYSTYMRIFELHLKTTSKSHVNQLLNPLTSSEEKVHIFTKTAVRNLIVHLSSVCDNSCYSTHQVHFTIYFANPIPILYLIINVLQ